MRAGKLVGGGGLKPKIVNPTDGFVTGMLKPILFTQLGAQLIGF
jgi:hypothetical protein